MADVQFNNFDFAQQMVDRLPSDVRGQISDGYHTFDELYDYRMLYNAMLFNEWYKNRQYYVHKALYHNDGTLCFNGNYFIVVALLPTGQISNHYPMKYWDMFNIINTGKALFEYDGHTPQDVHDRLVEFIKGFDNTNNNYKK